jgi:hypothetical protein
MLQKLNDTPLGAAAKTFYNVSQARRALNLALRGVEINNCAPEPDAVA